MHFRKILIVFALGIALTLAFNGCENLLGSTDDSPSDSGEETYNVKLEVSSDDVDTAAVQWGVGSDGATESDRDLPWTKEDTCGEDVSLSIAAGTPKSDGAGEGDELTATISIDGEVEATATGQYDSDHEEIAVVVETDSPSPN